MSDLVAICPRLLPTMFVIMFEHRYSAPRRRLHYIFGALIPNIMEGAVNKSGNPNGYSGLFYIMLILGIIGVIGFIVVATGAAAGGM
jgi:hypothetical protein